MYCNIYIIVIFNSTGETLDCKCETPVCDCDTLECESPDCKFENIDCESPNNEWDGTTSTTPLIIGAIVGIIGLLLGASGLIIACVTIKQR